MRCSRATMSTGLARFGGRSFLAAVSRGLSGLARARIRRERPAAPRMRLRPRNQHGNLDLARRDRLDVDPVHRPALGTCARRRRCAWPCRGRRPRPSTRRHRGARLRRRARCRFFAAASVCGRSSSSTVKVMSAVPSSPTFCTIMSTTMLRRRFREKIELVPGRSGTPLIVTRASSLVSAAPLTARSAASRVRRR